MPIIIKSSYFILSVKARSALQNIKKPPAFVEEIASSFRPIVQLGDLYRLDSPYDGTGWSSLMYVDKDKTVAVLFAYSTTYHARTTFFETKLSGLDPDKKYTVTELSVANGHKSFWGDGRIYSGDYLMRVGVMLNINGTYDSSVLLITENK